MKFSSPFPPVRDSAPSAADCQPLPDGVVMQSRLLARIAYDHDQAILQLEFRDETVYRYFQVPSQIYQDILHADSKGAYFNHHIRNVFRGARLGAGLR